MSESLKAKKTPVTGPDFSAVKTRANAEELARNGQLKKLLLLPAEFGGQDIPENVLYVPAFAVEAKARIDNNIIKPLIAQRQVSRYAATPEYESDSFVPIAINISASDPRNFSARVAIWGRALEDKT